MAFVLTRENSIANHFISELRNVIVQQDRMRFRRNLERLGELFAYEISKTLVYETAEVETPLGVTQTALLVEQPVLAPLIRGGLPLQDRKSTRLNSSHY